MFDYGSNILNAFKSQKRLIAHQESNRELLQKKCGKDILYLEGGRREGGLSRASTKKIYPFPGPPWLFVGLLSDRNGSISKFRRCTQDQREKSSSGVRADRLAFRKAMAEIN